MIADITIVVYTFLLLGAAYLYLFKRYKLSFADGVKAVIRKNIKFILLTLALVIPFLIITLRYMDRMGADMCPLLLRWTTIIWGVYLLAKVDFHEQKIPNEIVLVMLGLRGAFLIYEAVVNHDYMKMVMTPPILGALTGALVMAVAFLISRKGVGMGDVKLFIVIGFFVGSTSIITTMFYTFFASAIVGIILLLTKKAGLKDSVPMAPFAFVGVVVEYVIFTIGG